MFYFMDGLQNWTRMELEQRQVSTIDKAITQAKALLDFKHDKGRANELKDSHAKGGEDRARAKSNTHPGPGLG